LQNSLKNLVCYIKPLLFKLYQLTTLNLVLSENPTVSHLFKTQTTNFTVVQVVVTGHYSTTDNSESMFMYLQNYFPYTSRFSKWLLPFFGQLQFCKNVSVYSIRGGADKSLSRPTSRSRRTESIVSFERWVSSCAKLQVFSCYRG